MLLLLLLTQVEKYPEMPSSIRFVHMIMLKALQCIADEQC